MNYLHSPENYSATSVNAIGLGVTLLLNLFDRLDCGIFGSGDIPDRRLTTAVRGIDPGYCLDAPEVMPAGGMSNFELPPYSDDDPPMWLAEQQLCNRDE